MYIYIYIWYPPPGTYPFIYTSLSFYAGCGPGESGYRKSAPIQAESLRIRLNRGTDSRFKIQDATKKLFQAS